MTHRRFPRSPDITNKPFEHGANPFADDVTTPIPPSENPLEGPADSEVQPYKPGGYVITLPDRSARVMLFGLIGATFIAISVVILLVVFFSTPLFSPEIVYCFPADLLGLAFAIPTWIMASKDLKAISAGAMQPTGRFRTRVGYWCGCIATLIGISPFLASAAAIIGAILS